MTWVVVSYDLTSLQWSDSAARMDAQHDDALLINLTPIIQRTLHPEFMFMAESVQFVLSVMSLSAMQ